MVKLGGSIPSVKKLILIRHGQTDYNKKHRYQGQRDIALNQKGMKQAEKIAAYLKNKEIDVIYSSDLKRAAVTAQRISVYHEEIEVITSPDLQELAFGDWEGLSYNEIKNKYPIKFKKWQEDPLKVGPPGGEKLKDFQKRVVLQLTEICQQDDGEKIVVVTHGGVIRIFIADILKMPIKNYWRIGINNCNLSIINYYDNDGFFLERINCPV